MEIKMFSSKEKWLQFLINNHHKESGKCLPIYSDKHLEDIFYYFPNIGRDENNNPYIPSGTNNTTKKVYVKKSFINKEIEIISKYFLGVREVEFIENIEDIIFIENTHNILIINNEDLSFEILGEIRCVLTKENNVGIISYDNFENLLWILIKTYILRHSFYLNEKSAAILPFDNRGNSGDIIGDLQIWNKRNSVISDVRTEARFKGLFISSHGTEDVVSLPNNEYLYNDNYKSCPYGGEYITPKELQAQVIFNSSCFGLRPSNSMLPKESIISTEFLRQLATVYISSEGIKHGPDAEVSLFYNLVEHGENMGDATKLINKWLCQTKFDFPCYTLIGDPSIVVNDKVDYEYSYDILKSRVRINNVKNKRLIKIVLPEGFENVIAVESKSYSDFYYSIIQEEGKQNIFIHDFFPLKENDIELNLITQDPFDDIKKINNPSNLLKKFTTTILKNSRQNEINNLNSKLKAIANQRRDKSYSTRSTKKYLKLIYNYKKDVYRLQENIIMDLIRQSSSENSLFLPEIYIDQTNHHFIKKTKCKICSEEANLFEIRHLTSGEKRESIYCPRCGVVQDSPINSKISIIIQGENTINSNDVFKQNVIIKNISKENCQGFVFMVYDGSDKCSDIKPKYKYFDLSPNTEKDITFIFESKKLMDEHLHYFKLFALVDFDILHLNKPFVIKNEGIDI